MQKMEEVGKRVRQNEGTNAENSDEASSSTGQGPQTGPAAERDEQPLETSAKKIRQQGAHSAQSGGGGGGKDASHVSANAQTSEPSSSAVSEPDYKMLYLKEIEKNKHLLQWILQLQSQLRNQMLDVCHPVASSPAAGIQQGAWAAKAKTADREGKDDGAKSETDTTSSSSVAGSPTAKSEQLPQQPSVKKAETSEPSGADGSSENQGAHAAGRSEETPSAARSRENATLDEGSPSDLGPLSQVSLVHDVSYTKEPDPAAMARTCCARCGTGFAFSRAFLSQRDFLVLPCPNCHVAVAIPPFPGAAPHKPRGLSANTLFKTFNSRACVPNFKLNSSRTSLRPMALQGRPDMSEA